MKLTLILALALPLMGQIIPTWADADGKATSMRFGGCTRGDASASSARGR